MKSFNIGDRVRVSGVQNGKSFSNTLGTVIGKAKNLSMYDIEFDEDIGGHRGLNNGKEGHCWICDANIIFPAEEESEVTFQVGDLVTDVTRKIRGVPHKGEVTSVDHEIDYPILVDFINDEGRVIDNDSYTKEGKFGVHNTHRSLYHSHNVEVNVTGEEIPVRTETKWVNIYIKEDGTIYGACKYATKEQAEIVAHEDGYLKTISIEVPIKE